MVCIAVEEITGQVARLSIIVLPGSARERNMAFYSAYFDESSGNNSPILVVAGFLSTDAQWGLFETEWKAVLAECGLSAFHMQHFATRKGEFRGMDESVRQALLGRLLDVTARRAKLGFAAVVHLQAFDEVFIGQDRQEIGSPYKMCCTTCFLEVGEWAKKNYQIEPVSYFFDAGNAHGEEVSHHFLESKNDPDNREYRLGSITFEHDDVLVPLQAADIAVGPWLNLETRDFHLSTQAAHGLIAMAVQSYKDRRPDKKAPDEVFIHGRTTFNDLEWEGFRSAVPSQTNIVGVKIRDDASLKLYRFGDTPVLRGTAFIRNPRTATLWTRGWTPRLATYPGLEVPNPLTVEITQGNMSIETVLNDIMALTKLNYNACQFADGSPITLKFANAVGEVLTAGPSPGGGAPLPFMYYI